MVAARAKGLANPDQANPDQTRSVARSGISELDALLGGGLHYGTSTLVMGPAGTGKSTLVTQYALALSQARKRVVCYVFEETRENFLERARGLGMDLHDELAAGHLSVEQIDPAEMSPGEFAQNVKDAVESGVGVIVIDSLNGYLNAMPSESFLLIQMHELLTYLNMNGVLTLMTLAQHGLLGTAMSSPVDLTYLADSVIVLRYFEAFGAVRQALAVIKKRTGGHEHSIRQFSLTSQGIRIGQPLNDFEGVLTGIPVYRGNRDGLIEEPKS
jgi:circadian clock protein KaiC